MKNGLIATGRVVSLCVNGGLVPNSVFLLDGPFGDYHSGIHRRLSGHDGVYIATSALQKGDAVFNWRTWTALSLEDILEVEKVLNVVIPPGCLLENFTVSGIPNFSQLAPTSRLVFERGPDSRMVHQRPTLAVWEENSPCKTVGNRVEVLHGYPGLTAKFVEAALGRRGVMGFVLREGIVDNGDIVRVYPPAE